MSFLQTIYYSCATVYMMSVGWILHPEAYERYYTAWKLVRENPEWVKNNLLQPKNLDANNIQEKKVGK